jgi:hypothetical protein
MSEKGPKTRLESGLEGGLKRPGKSPGRPESGPGRPESDPGGPKNSVSAIARPGKGLRLPAGRPKTHGGYTYLLTGKLPEHRRAITRYLTEVREGLISDYGPIEADLSASQKILINEITTSAGFLRLVEEHCRETGAIGPDGELRHCLSAFYLSMLNSQRLNILALKNIGRRERPAPSLADLIKTIDEETAARDAKIPDMGVEGKAIARPGASGRESQGEGETLEPEKGDPAGPGAVVKADEVKK